MGMRSITRSNQPVAPARVMSAPLARKAPTASAMDRPPASAAEATTAAPGVDQATITGLRSQRDGSAVHSPMPRPRAQIQEVICSGVADNA